MKDIKNYNRDVSEMTLSELRDLEFDIEFEILGSQKKLKKSKDSDDALEIENEIRNFKRKLNKVSNTINRKMSEEWMK